VPATIYYFATARHTYTLGIYTAFYASASGPTIRIVPYSMIPFVAAFEPGAFIFTDFDRMSAAAIEHALPLVEALEASGSQILNHPARVPGRFDPLRRLHQAGINAFNVHRVDDWRDVTRFPAFIRAEAGHDKPTTELIEDARALEQAVDGLKRKGGDTSGLMIVEFGNAPDEEGRYFKYSAFRVGDTIYAQHCFSSRNWWIKFANADRDERIHEENRRFIKDNPHRDQLEEIFRIADIEYGRADYCVVDGRVQIFEINTNPTVIEFAPGGEFDLTPFAGLHENALTKLARSVKGAKKTENPLFGGSAAPIDPADMMAKLNKGFQDLDRRQKAAGAAGPARGTGQGRR